MMNRNGVEGKLGNEQKFLKNNISRLPVHNSFLQDPSLVFRAKIGAITNWHTTTGLLFL